MSKLPSGYTELEYLESSGTQYIDTGHNPTQTSRMVLDFAFLGTAGQNVAGARNTSSDSTNRFGIVSFGDDSTLGGLVGAAQIRTISLDQSRHVFDISSSGIVADGTTYAASGVGTFSCTCSVLLFAWNNGTNGVSALSCRVYSCKIYSGDEMIRDFVPCKNPSGTLGLYDCTSGQFYSNSGTVTFTSGSEIAVSASEEDITELQYIESTGTQYINTGVRPTSAMNLTMECALTATTAPAAFFGARTAQSTTDAEANTLLFTSGSKVRSDFYGSSVTGNTSPALQNYSISRTTNTTDFSGETLTNTAKTKSTSIPLYLFAINTAGTAMCIASMRLFSCDIYIGETEVRSFTPAKLSDGTVGLYDSVSGMLYINAGTGTFTAGPEAPQTPSAPKNLAASVSEYTVSLNWEAASKAAGYRLKRGDTQIADQTATSYTDTVETTGVSYTYSVLAYNTYGESAEVFTTAYVPYIPTSAPGAVQNLTARVSLGTVQLAWAPHIDASSYRITRDGVQIAEVTEPGYSDTGLFNGRTYVYTVIGVNSLGVGPAVEISATPEFILVTDRAAEDVARVNELAAKGYAGMTAAELAEWLAGMKGAYNAADLNRVGTALNYLRDRLVPLCGKDIRWSAKTDWAVTDVITAEQADTYHGQIKDVRDALVYPADAPGVPEIELLTYSGANDIERILEVCDALVDNIVKAYRYTNAAECATGGLI